jgi:ATP/maltotriose-dependent transcriptional regulator MalT
MALLKRPRLVLALGDAPQRITLVAAGAGFGKSVAIRQLCESVPGAVLHYEVRGETFVPFVRGFAQAAAELAPGLRASFAGAIELAMQAAKPHEEAALWMVDHLKAAKIHTIAIEDLHRAAADERVTKFLVRLVADTPERTRWILAAREGWALPERELAQSGIAVASIGEDDLRLTQSEAAALAKSAGLARGDVRRLHEVTGGEPAAFHLGTHVFDARDVPADSAYEHYADRYFEQCPANLQELLLGVCVFDEVDEELLRRSPWATCAHYVPSLAGNGLVFSPRDRGRYHIHEPFRARLRARLGDESVRSDAQRSGALLLEQQGLVSDALELYLKADDPASVLRLCEQYGFELADHAHLDVLRRALSWLGEEQLHKSAPLLALRAISESFAGRTDTAEAWYLHALRAAEARSLQATLAHRYAIDLIRQGRADAVALLEPYARDSSIQGDLAANIHSTLATAYVVAGRFDDARGEMERALHVTSSSDSVTLHAAIQHQAAWVSLFTGAIESARQHAQRAVELALSCDAYHVAARAYSVLYNIRYDLEDDVHAALKILNDIWDCGMKAGDVRMRLFALACSFDIAAELGDTQRLEQMQRTLEAHEVDYADPLVSQTVLPAQALRLAAAGEFLEAFRLLQPTAERQPMGDRQALRFAEIALYAAAAGLLGEARSIIAHVLELVEALEPTVYRTMRTNAVLSVVLYLVGRRSDAVGRLRGLSRAQEPSSLRIRMLTQTLEVLFARWDGADNFAQVLDALQSLRASDFGGIAAVLAALPYALPVNAA